MAHINGHRPVPGIGNQTRLAGRPKFLSSMWPTGSLVAYTRDMKPLLTWLTVWVLVLGALSPTLAEDPFQTSRERMVREQIAARGVSDPRVLAAMRAVPRHLFVAPQWRPMAYADQPLPIGQGQTISQPYIVAYMTAALRLGPADKVLEIGTGSGYQAAVLAHVTDQVFSIEVQAELAEQAKKRLADLGYGKIHLLTGDGYKGWPRHAPFRAIIVTCAPDKIPKALIEQLALGGRMVIPVGPAGAIQKLVLVQKDAQGGLSATDLMLVRFVPMVH